MLFHHKNINLITILKFVENHVKKDTRNKSKGQCKQKTVQKNWPLAY